MAACSDVPSASVKYVDDHSPPLTGAAACALAQAARETTRIRTEARRRMRLRTHATPRTCLCGGPGPAAAERERRAREDERAHADGDPAGGAYAVVVARARRLGLRRRALLERGRLDGALELRAVGGLRARVRARTGVGHVRERGLVRDVVGVDAVTQRHLVALQRARDDLQVDVDHVVGE